MNHLDDKESFFRIVKGIEIRKYISLEKSFLSVFKNMSEYFRLIDSILIKDLLKLSEEHTINNYDIISNFTDFINEKRFYFIFIFIKKYGEECLNYDNFIKIVLESKEYAFLKYLLIEQNKTKNAVDKKIIPREKIILESQDAIISCMEKKQYFEGNTGIYNKYFLDKLITENDYNYHVISIDIKLFKDINDNFGQDFGDEVINGLMQHLNNVVGNLDRQSYAIRNGGDEFIVLLHKEYTSKELQQILKEINKIIKVDFSKDIPLKMKKERVSLKLAFGTKTYEENLSLKKAVQEANLKVSSKKSLVSRRKRFLKHVEKDYSPKSLEKLLEELKLIKEKL